MNKEMPGQSGVVGGGAALFLLFYTITIGTLLTNGKSEGKGRNIDML